jgi:hypothetical protein
MDPNSWPSQAFLMQEQITSIFAVRMTGLPYRALDR